MCHDGDYSFVHLCNGHTCFNTTATVLLLTLTTTRFRNTAIKLHNKFSIVYKHYHQSNALTTLQVPLRSLPYPRTFAHAVLAALLRNLRFSKSSGNNCGHPLFSPERIIKAPKILLIYHRTRVIALQCSRLTLLFVNKLLTRPYLLILRIFYLFTVNVSVKQLFLHSNYDQHIYM